SPRPSRTPPTAAAQEVDVARAQNWAVGARPVRDIPPVCPFVRRRHPVASERGNLMSRSEPHRRLTVLLTAGAYLLITLDALVVVTALPSIHGDLGGGAGNLPWIINAYALTFASGIITASALGDRWGRRRTYVGGLLLFTTASAACALAPS